MTWRPEGGVRITLFLAGQSRPVVIDLRRQSIGSSRMKLIAEFNSEQVADIKFMSVDLDECPSPGHHLPRP